MPLFQKLTGEYYSNPMKRGYLSSPAVDLSELGLAPPENKPISPLAVTSLTELLAQSHAVILSSVKKAKLGGELIDAKKIYEEEVELAKKYGYLHGSARIPRRLRKKEQINA